MTEALKDSKVEWVGKIPLSWTVTKNKYCFTNKKQLVGEKWDETQLLSLTKNGVKKKDINDGGGKQPDSFSTYQYVVPNQIVMCLFDLDQSAVFSGISQYEGMISPAYKILTCMNNTIPKYISYWFDFVFQRRKFKTYSKNIRYTLDYDEFGKLPIILPPKDEQEKIADFLDEKCAEIDKLSEDIQKQIDILNDYKKSVITRAVTKGLDPNAEMKESGIDYLGKYPMNWKLSRVKFNLKEPMKYGATESGVEYSEDLPRYIRITDITSDNKLKDDGKLSLTWQQAKRYMLSSDTVLFARSGGTVGKTFYYRPSYGKAAFAGYLISAIPNEKKMLTEWLYFYTLSNAYWEWANQIFTQATIQNIGADKYSNLPITAPDIETQKTIISYLTNRCSEIDESIALKQNQLDRLATYKKSIIYEYVTGKKRVKGAL